MVSPLPSRLTSSPTTRPHLLVEIVSFVWAAFEVRHAPRGGQQGSAAYSLRLPIAQAMNAVRKVEVAQLAPHPMTPP